MASRKRKQSTINSESNDRGSDFVHNQSTDDDDRILYKLYYSLASPASFSGLEKLYREARKNSATISRSKVKRWLSSQLTYTIHRPVSRLRFATRPVVVYDIDEQWQMDLVDLTKLSRYNSGFKYLLTCIDVLSKFAFVQPLKTKTGKELNVVMERMFQQRKPKLIHTDQGTEFLNTHVKRLLKEHGGIKLFFTYSERKASIVERFNRTFKNLMFKYFTKYNTYRYIDVLQDMVERYNNSYHRSIKMNPSEVTKENAPLAWVNLYEKRLNSGKRQAEARRRRRHNRVLKIGQHVRISIERTVFQKRYEQSWTEEIFIITHVLGGNGSRSPIVYKLKDQADEPLKGVFYRDELQTVTEPRTYRIEKILRKKKNTRDGTISYLVKWKGYSNKFNSYVSEKDIEAIGGGGEV
ncbi:uncharacterized protein [Clytia hemisphaerica]|uniref:uncharacterized protein n=1 Tax=Clytia hemisphaerica TaxID=252671 RepID=UPI0034D4DC71